MYRFKQHLASTWKKNECRQISIGSRTWGRYIRFMFMEDEQAATFYATVTFRRTLLVDNHPHFIFLRNRTKPVFLIMIWFIEQQKSVERDICYQSFLLLTFPCYNYMNFLFFGFLEWLMYWFRPCQSKTTIAYRNIEYSIINLELVIVFHRFVMWRVVQYSKGQR